MQRLVVGGNTRRVAEQVPQQCRAAAKAGRDEDGRLIALRHRPRTGGRQIRILGSHDVLERTPVDMEPVGLAPDGLQDERVVALRDQGKTAFLHLTENGEKLQAYLRKDTLTEQEWEVVKLLDLGDFISVTGTVMRTRTGELTLKLHELLPDSRVTGLDSSTAMLQRASQLARPGLEFQQGTVEAVAGTWDLVFSHAVLHWVDDHPRLIPRLLGLLAPGGQLAVQMPANYRHPAHEAIVEIAGQEPFAKALGGWYRQSPMLEIDTYAELLLQHGAEEITVLEKVYPTVMSDGPTIAEWTRGSTLVPYLERLPVEMHEPFLERYRQRLAELYPGSPVYFTFRRILLAASRPR